MKACRLAAEAGETARAAELARQASALDPDAVAGDPLVYKMHLLGRTPRFLKLTEVGPTAEGPTDGRAKLRLSRGFPFGLARRRHPKKFPLGLFQHFTPRRTRS